MNILAIKKSNQNVWSKKEQEISIWEFSSILASNIAAIAPAGVEKKRLIWKKIAKTFWNLGKSLW